MTSQVWNTIRHRIGSHGELCNTFGDKLGRYDGSDRYERQLLDIPPKPDMSSISIFIFARGTWGRVWVDNVRVQKVKESQ